MLRRSRRLALLAGLSLTAGLVPVLSAAPAAAVSPDVVIAEVYGGGGNAGATLKSDFIELLNTGDSAVDLSTWSVQYASSTGTTWARTNLSGTIAAGGRYLVKQADGAGGTTDLPAPDATGTTAMSGTAAKVALVSSQVGCTGTDCGGASNAVRRDLVGWGTTANAFEGSAPAAGTANSTSAARGATGLDTDDNARDFTVGAPTPQNSGTPVADRPSASCPATLTTEAGTAAQAALSARVPGAGIASAVISSTPTAGISLEGFSPSAGGQPAPATLTVGSTVPSGDHPVTVTFTTDETAPRTARCTIAVSVLPPPPLLAISQVQGSGATSPQVGRRVSVDAVVTTTKTAGDRVVSYFLQEQDADADADSTTSEGLQVFCGAACPAGLAAGAVVRATGVVQESFTQTRLDASGGTSVVGATAPRPTPATTLLPAATSTTSSTTFESVEGMLTTIPGTLTVTEFFNLSRFGEVVLSAGGRPYQFTHENEPSVAGNAAHRAALAKTRIVFDDGSEDQNDAVTGPTDEAYPFPSGGLSVTNRFRGGDTLTDVVAVIEYGFSAWRLQPVPTETYVPFDANPRSAQPDAVGGRLTVGSFNVLNYFDTIDTTPSDGTGPCAPSGTQDCRGADSEVELLRQQAKIVAALQAVDADVLGLIEIQNDADVSLARLVGALNAATGAGTYDYVRTGTIGTDAIKVALVYKAKVVNPVGPYAVLDASVDPTFVDTANRPALIQTFQQRKGGGRLTVAVNHFKSKGSACSGDPDENDGAGNCDGTRTAAAMALARYLATDPTGSDDPDFLVVGDLNSYKRERPITALKAAGYTDLIERFQGEDAYGYLFDGQLGYLDHALASSTLGGQVTGATEWHINADEPVELDYNDAVRDAGEQPFARRSTAAPLFAADPYRSSDHDAVVVGLDLVPGAAPVKVAPVKARR